MGGAGWSRPQNNENLVEEETTVDLADLQETREEESEEVTEEETAEDRNVRREYHKKEMEEFRQMLDRKRDERRQAISKISEEMANLRKNQEDLEKERTLRIGLERQVKALKEVSTVSNEMLQLRETQVTQLKKRLETMEVTAEENLTNLRNQYESQIENIRRLKQLYEERAEAAARGHEKEMEKEKAKNTLLEIKLGEHANDAVTIQKLNEKAEELEKKLAEKETETEELKEIRSSLVAECHTVTSQLTLINNLFSNMLTGDMDFDLLTRLLQDNHNLITDLIANGDINDTAALLVNIAEKSYKKGEISSPANTNAKQEIAANLPKVWRMLIELLNSHEDSNHVVQGTSEECYKHIKTPSGSRTVISVSQTFLRLKDLILEKNSLVKEVGRLKTLNGHLEHRLDLQEKRLSVVSSELRKTWGIVSKLKVQHRQLHTHEKILRYELQHKRQMLTDLKQELEYCKETWDRVREKNTQSEHDWELLRKEFALRKSRDASNSAESGYEDDENSQSPDTSASELEYDLSDSQKSSELDNPSIELEDAASDATVIELIDMLDFEDETAYAAESSGGESRVSCSEDDRAGSPAAAAVPCSSVSEVAEGETRPQSLDTVPAENDNETKESSLVPVPPPKESISVPGSSAENSIPAKTRSSEEILDARAARLRRLEQQCKSLLNQMALTSLRSDTLSTRLEELHEQYGSEDRRSQPSTKTEAIETESASSANVVGEGRTSRIQQMEQTCIQMLENVSQNADESAVKFEDIIAPESHDNSSANVSSSEEPSDLVRTDDSVQNHSDCNEI